MFVALYIDLKEQRAIYQILFKFSRKEDIDFLKKSVFSLFNIMIVNNCCIQSNFNMCPFKKAGAD